MAEDSPVFNFAENNFQVGINIIGKKIDIIGDPEKKELQFLTEFVDLDLSEIIDIQII